MRANVVRDGEGLFYAIRINCPCGECIAHLLPVSWLPEGETVESPHAAGKPHWTFNGNFEKPTFAPSILTRCKFGDGRGDHVCHSFVRDGRIEFLGDCTHTLAGQTVDLPEISND